MKRYCQNCGFENADKNKFCMRCGIEIMDKKIESNAPVEPIQQQSYEVQDAPKHSAEKRFVKPGKIVVTSNKTISGLAVGAIVLAIVAILLALLFNPALNDNSVTGAKVVDGSIGNEDIDDNGISKIADDSIGSAQIIDASIVMNDLSSSTISDLTSEKFIASDSITGDKIANFSVNSSDLANNSVTSQKIADGTISSADIGTDAVSSDEIASGAVGTSEITDGSIAAADIANNAVTYDKMSIKIKYDSDSAYNGSSIAHGISGTPTCVVVTPIYNSASYANATIIANVYSVGSTYFYLTLYYQYAGGSLTPVPSGTPVTVYWIAIY